MARLSIISSLLKNALFLFISGFVVMSFSSSEVQKKEKIIQVNLDKILNARPVTTLTQGKPVTWTKGIDGNGEADGYLTRAAAVYMGNPDPKALPDNPLIPANEKHPGILLHYSNSDGTSNQAVAVKGSGNFSFEILTGHYSSMFLAFTSSEGATKVKVSFTYMDGTETKSFEIPDYYIDLPENSPDVCYLVHDLAKWGKMNNMTEKDHHNIDLLDVHPDPERSLVNIKVEKSESGYLVFWAATGIEN